MTRARILPHSLGWLVAVATLVNFAARDGNLPSLPGSSNSPEAGDETTTDPATEGEGEAADRDLLLPPGEALAARFLSLAAREPK